MRSQGYFSLFGRPSERLLPPGRPAGLPLAARPALGAALPAGAFVAGGLPPAGPPVARLPSGGVPPRFPPALPPGLLPGFAFGLAPALGVEPGPAGLLRGGRAAGPGVASRPGAPAPGFCRGRLGGRMPEPFPSGLRFWLGLGWLRFGCAGLFADGVESRLGRSPAVAELRAPGVFVLGLSDALVRGTRRIMSRRALASSGLFLSSSPC